MKPTKRILNKRKLDTKDAYCTIPYSQRSKEARLNMTVMTVDTLGVIVTRWDSERDNLGELFLNMGAG